MSTPSTISKPITTDNKKQNQVADFFRRLIIQKKLGAAGGLIVLVMLLTGIFANVLAPYGMNEIHMEDTLTPSSSKYILGTDNLGRDMFSRIIFGARVSMIIGLAGAGLGMVVSTLIGLTSGYIGGTYDLIMQRLVDAWVCFPSLIIYLTLVSIFGGGMVQLILVLGIGGGIGGGRLVRGYAISLKNEMYVQAAHAQGSGMWRILVKHILPNIYPILIISFTLGMAGMILAEAGLSFLGLGLPPSVSSWGGMLSGSNRAYMERAPWLVIWPGVALSLVIYGINMFGDAIRDLLDPRLRGGVGGMGERGIELVKKELRRREKKAIKSA
jgi:peptide/nickel transport system permease protein